MDLHERDDPPGLIRALLWIGAACLLALYFGLLLNDPVAVWVGLWS
ncbi:MAG: hypothetical protein U1A72_12660 [Sulfuritalea sp.]|nr:hypothetical protein [Sulfuritalea sp.]